MSAADKIVMNIMAKKKRKETPVETRIHGTPGTRKSEALSNIVSAPGKRKIVSPEVMGRMQSTELGKELLGGRIGSYSDLMKEFRTRGHQTVDPTLGRAPGHGYEVSDPTPHILKLREQGLIKYQDAKKAIMDPRGGRPAGRKRPTGQEYA